MRRRKRRKNERGRKKLTYGIIAVAFLIIPIAFYLSSNQPNQTSQPKAAIVDHLSRREPNQTFVQTSISILEEAGFEVAYHGWQKLTDVNYYKDLFKQSYDLLVLRVHSAITIIDGAEVVGIFTWERYSDSVAGAKYLDDVMDDRLVKAFFQEDPDVYYFGIAPKFVENYGDFKDTLIIMMGCNGLTYTSMAESFIKKGARAYIGWNGLVSVDHTDQATILLLQSLLLEKRTIRTAVEKIEQDPAYHSLLDYYPLRFGDYIIQSLESSLVRNVINTSLTTKSPEKKRAPVA